MILLFSCESYYGTQLLGAFPNVAEALEAMRIHNRDEFKNKPLSRSEFSLIENGYKIAGVDDLAVDYASEENPSLRYRLLETKVDCGKLILKRVC